MLCVLWIKIIIPGIQEQRKHSNAYKRYRREYKMQKALSTLLTWPDAPTKMTLSKIYKKYE